MKISDEMDWITSTVDKMEEDKKSAEKEMNRQDDRDTLLPCPFCGGEPEKRSTLHVRCSNQKCDISTSWMRYEQWNTRDESHLKQKIRTATLDDAIEVGNLLLEKYPPMLTRKGKAIAEYQDAIDNLRGK